MAAAKRIMKEWKELRQAPIEGWSAGPTSEDDLFKWMGVMKGPDSTPYEDGEFVLSIQFPSDYPFKPPRLIFVTRIFHMNINSQGGFCFEPDYMKDDWSPAVTISKILPIIRQLFREPAPDSPYVPEISKFYLTNRAAHDRQAREFTRKHATPISGSALVLDASEP